MILNGNSEETCFSGWDLNLRKKNEQHNNWEHIIVAKRRGGGSRCVLLVLMSLPHDINSEK